MLVLPQRPKRPIYILDLRTDEVLIIKGNYSVENSQASVDVRHYAPERVCDRFNRLVPTIFNDAADKETYEIFSPGADMTIFGCFVMDYQLNFGGETKKVSTFKYVFKVPKEVSVFRDKVLKRLFKNDSVTPDVLRLLEKYSLAEKLKSFEHGRR